MSKIEKILKKWESKPTEVSKDEVVNVLERFGFELDLKRGSHIVVRHLKLIDQPNFGSMGEFTIPSKHGRTVKGVYLKKILIAIKIVTEEY
ncbi:MAG: type II toxin-antitoxin system HicA family toxin [Calditrichaeota bacterium]|nr:type II toxin-antitoxin system HicA family toxin [Calditrichota bacterium]